MGQHQSIVSAEWLKDNLNNPDIKIIDCRFRLPDANWGYQQYNHSHIKNAYYLDLNNHLSNTVTDHGGRHPLPDNKLLATKFEQIGIIKNKTTVVVYDDSRFAFCARLWWLLRFLGHHQVFILDGGWHHWQQLNYPTDNVIPSDGQGSFIPEPNFDLTVDIQQVKQAQTSPTVATIDARSGDRHLGKTEPIDPIAGSIPHSHNVFWQQNSTPEGFLKSKLDLETIWQAYLKYPEIIAYCGSGVTACVNIFALETIGYHNCKLYAGGWSDWCSYLQKSENLISHN
ncbi:sulfurtransferase [Cyanobacterium sp. IPPAS B-1200]|uniref:sulfurtransferase n=1 Tax=Cyanobacterium sp. IPPAS B-1200 TaxID=1562720 RepID=UPI0008527537|nr:sulfurtransferase [Cyanobacterium sp. IPPAS B-1200]OEJ78523.1 3-mercaptopyruvate sulfurtransferase [Cyanobacterium sp. IPPAS B-1200]